MPFALNGCKQSNIKDLSFAHIRTNMKTRARARARTHARTRTQAQAQAQTRCSRDKQTTGVHLKRLHMGRETRALRRNILELVLPLNEPHLRC
jgi:hypothetical protein